MNPVFKRGGGWALSAAVALAAWGTASAAADPLVREPDRVVTAIPAEERPRGEPQAPSGLRDYSARVPNRRLVEREKRRAARELDAGGRSGDDSEQRSGPQAAPRAATFGGLNQPGLAAVTGSPPDTTGAIGPSDYVEMVNVQIALYNRTNLSQTAVRDLDDFVGFPGEAVFDPQVKWDEQANRFFFVADDCTADCEVGDKFLAYGWSKTADPGNLVSETPSLPPNPAADWCTFFIDTSPDFHDYPKLGSNNDHIIIGANAFNSAGDFLTAVVWAIPQPALGSTECGPTPTAFQFGTAVDPLETADGDVAFTPVPASTFGAAANGFVIAADFPPAGGDNQLMAWHVSGPPAGPTLTADGNIVVSPFGVPPNVPQPVPTERLDSLDSRLTQAQAAADPDAGGELAVWTQHTIAGGAGSALRWYELLPGRCSGGACPPGALRQQGQVSNSALFVFNGAISPSANGNAAVVNYNVGGASRSPDLRSSSRQAADPLGEMRAEVLLGASSAATEEFTCDTAGGDPCRWGDYAGASPDPLNPNVVWGSNQLIGPPKLNPLLPHWATRNFALIADHFAPETSITSGPAEGATTANPTPTFGFSANEQSTFECALDGGAFGACSGPGAAHTSGTLAPGAHAFQVRATDAVGNVDPTPAIRSFTVAQPVKPPEVKLEARKRQRVDKLRAKAVCRQGPCAVTLKGKAVLAKKGERKKRFKLKPSRAQLETGERAKKKLKFKKHRRTVRKISSLIKRKGYAGKVKLKLIGRNEAGRDKAKRTIRKLLPKR